MVAQPAHQQEYDVVVVGAGFGGMAAALELARNGVSVALFESLTYPGGCASTFKRRSHQFESGATLFSGFGEGQLFRNWIDTFGLDVEFEAIDPVVQMRTETFTLGVPGTRHELVRRFCALPGAERFPIEAFFARQERVASVLWELFDDPDLIPPFGVSELLRHAARSPRYLKLLPLLGQPLSTTLERWGVAGFEPLRTYLNAVCQITVQASVDEAESPFALAAMDYYFRGTGHIHGGIGQLAWEMIRAFERFGGDVFMADGVNSLRHDGQAWQVSSRRRNVRAHQVIANLLPQSVATVVGESSARLERLGEQVATGWGAVMLYLSVPDDCLKRDDAHHLELVSRNDSPFVEGNHVFVSISGRDEIARAPEGRRTITASTHVPMPKFVAMSTDERGVYIAGIQAKMRDTLTLRAPEIMRSVELEMTASPRTFERFTQRPEGYVGGVPRRAGLHNYRDFLPTPVLKDLYLVGDTVFPGQSTLATAIGGVKVAQSLL